jgi:hypothetical protein
MFYSYFEFQTMNKVQKSSDSEVYTPIVRTLYILQEYYGQWVGNYVNRSGRTPF